eukprot:CAMPEP_0183388512 /NCGR_PEP_ID=MMETSP0370-20130417/4139_1 /TAXON_ID=268820 /ORGANISM="Peridinium aciculiferum, Strain PAER-2" /LENGTH=56 /DNA_ID=CAMNT_0025567473 /DNA_START=150 /DNA_END=320 /DNA_ORIENTATION=-
MTINGAKAEVCALAYEETMSMASRAFLGKGITDVSLCFNMLSIARCASCASSQSTK